MLRNSAGWPEICAEQAQAGLRGSAFIVAAKEGERTVGMTRLISDGGYFYMVVDVVVHPDYQKQGIGRELMAQAIAHIKSKMKDDHKNYTLLSSADGKEGFYEKMGFFCIPNEWYGSGMIMKVK